MQTVDKAFWHEKMDTNRYFATAYAEVNLDADILAVHDMLESAEVEIGKHMPVHLLLHCDPCSPSDPEARAWLGQVENAVADLNPLFKDYEFKLKHDESGLLLEFHLLVPPSCSVDRKETEKALSSAFAASPRRPHLNILIDQPSEEGKNTC